MPEGDTIVRAARTLHRALAGRVVTRFESAYPALNRMHDDHPLTGRIIEAVTSRGKHLLMTFSGDLILHTHMRMHGSWHLYRPGERWQRAARDMRLLVETAEYVAVGFVVPVAEFLTRRDLARHTQLQSLGPDLAEASLDRDDVIRRIREHGAERIHDVLLNQRVLAGIGNELKSEILFVSRIDPFAPVSALNDQQLHRLIDQAQKLMKMNIAGRESPLSVGTGRRTTGSLDPHVNLWVYGRGGEPCRRCGTLIQRKKTGTDARPTYWCPSCQASETR